MPSLGPPIPRRQFLAQAGGGAGLLVLAALLADEGALTSAASAEDAALASAANPRLNPLAPNTRHFPAHGLTSHRSYSV